MNIIAHMAMLGWIPLTLLLFSVLPPRRAVVVSFIAGWLFLPVAAYDIPILRYNKISATCMGALLAALLFDNERVAAFRPTPADVPLLLWLCAPFLSSVSNDLGLWDAASATFKQSIAWGAPYVLGRIYLSDTEGLRELALGIFFGGLVYVPLCLIETRISPQLHHRVYGFLPHYDFSQTYRMGGWRPMVFMSHGLMVGVWMTAACLIGYWMYRCKALGDLSRRFYLKYALPVLLGTTVWIRSLGSLFLLCMGIALLHLSTRLRVSAFAGLALLLPVAYMFSGIMDMPLGQTAVDMLDGIVPDRAASLKFRVDNERLLVDKAMRRPLLGWGGWGRSRVYNELGEDISVTDSLWIITLGQNGLFGLASLSLMFGLPLAGFFRRRNTDAWSAPESCHTAALAVLLLLYAVDNLLNAMPNPVFVLALGALTGHMLRPAPLRAVFPASRSVPEDDARPKAFPARDKISQPRFL